MKHSFSLSARTFLLSFLCMCAVLIAGFIVLNAAIKARIKKGLKETAQHVQQQLDETEAEYNRRNTELIAMLSQDAGLKAAVGLLREQSGPDMRSAARRTIEDQLRGMSGALDYDLLMILDTDGQVAATAGATISDAQVNSSRLLAGSPALVRFGQVLFEVTTVPINLGVENLGSLAVGKRFQLNAPGRFGDAVLLERDAIAAGTLPKGLNGVVARQLSEHCGRQVEGCEIRAGNESYLVLGMNRAGLGPDYRLLCLAPIDDAMHGFMRGLRSAFIVTGIGGVLIALLLSLFASRAIARPLADLASQLEKSARTGALWGEFRLDSSTREVNVLGGALNNAAIARRQVEGELRDAKDAAEAASRAKSEFMANVSHELRTPMNGILGMTDLVLDAELTPQQREDLTMVKSSAEGLLTIINDILDFSKIEAGKLDLDLIEFDLRDSLDETVRTLKLRSRQKGLELTCEVQRAVPKILIGDPLRLRQILINLVGNAIKFTEQGEVRVRVETEWADADSCVLQFVVQDTGIGIPRDKQKVIFEAFSQADGSATRKYSGTGLGLTISSQLVEMMQGRVSVESEVGRGSCFRFSARFGIPPVPGPTARQATLTGLRAAGKEPPGV
jgi:signal transduction histidine kinase